MVFRWLADLTVVAHMAFVAFVIAGALLALRRTEWAWFHVPAVAWGAMVELAGWVCPLTPLENWFRRQAGGAGYRDGFVEHYVLPVLYPSGLTRGVQITLGCLVLVINIALYTVVWTRYRRQERS